MFASDIIWSWNTCDMFWIAAVKRATSGTETSILSYCDWWMWELYGRKGRVRGIREMRFICLTVDLHDTRRKENTPFPFQKKGEILLHFTSCGHIKHHFYALYISQKLRARWLCRLPHSISKLSASARKSIQRERGREKENRDCMRLSVCLVSDSTSLPMSCFIAPEKS